MNEHEFDNILQVVSEELDVPKSKILQKHCTEGALARHFISHVIYHGHVHLRNTFIERLGCTRHAFYNGADVADALIHKSVEHLCILNEIRVKVGLPRLKRAVTHKDTISNTKNLFGFDYTELDELRFRNACRNTMDYMRKLCSIGRKPIPEGMVRVQARPKPTYDSWYKD